MSILSSQGLTRVVDGQTVHINTDSTRGDVVAQYLSGLNPFANLLALTQNSGQNSLLTSDVLSSQVPALTTAITNLLTLANDGVVELADPTNPAGPKVKYYLTGDMAQGLDEFIKSLQAVGVTVSNNPPSVSNLTGDTMRKWLDLSMISPIIGQVIANCQQAAATATSTLQALVELEYVKNANDTLSNKMINLENALSLTQNVLKVLTSVQQLHNNVTPNTTKAGPVNLNDPSLDAGKDDKKTTTNTGNAYNANDAPAFKGGTGFGVSIPAHQAGAFTNIALSASITTSAFSAFKGLETQLKGQLSALSASHNSSTEIFKRVKQVLSDMQKFDANANTAATWFIDNYGSAGVTKDSGLYQQNISTAITSAENLNNSQQQNVQQFMFVFQEYYQSASTVLSKLSQIIEQAGQAIRGG